MSSRLSVRNLLVALAIVAPMLALPAAQAQISVGLSVNIAPPVLPVYEQPPLPAPGYIWTPGYWAYGEADTSGFPECGCSLRAPDFFGRRATGDMKAESTDGTQATGDRTSASTAA